MSAWEPVGPRPDYSKLTLSIIEFKIWDLPDQAVIQSNGVYDGHHLPARRNLGASLLGRRLVGEVAPLDNKIWDIGKLIQEHFRELSTPKD